MHRFDSLFTEADLIDLWDSTVGIERETVRINHDGSIAQTPHPKDWGNRSFHPYIQTDFGEAQLEFITPPSNSAKHIMSWLKSIHQVAATTNDKHQEWLWPLSPPGSIPEGGKITVAQLDNPKEIAYREHLARYYGDAVQLLSGIHYNFQINPKLIQAKISSDADPVSVKNKIYAKLGRNYLRYRWILTYLLGASTFVPDNYETNLFGRPSKMPMRSVRQSRYGYKNEDDLKIRYDAIENFVEDLEEAVLEQKLSLEKELYADVRFRKASPARELLTKGIQYIEFRNFDLNPYAPYGITEEDIEFIKLFIITLIFLPDASTNEQVEYGNQIHRSISEAHPWDSHGQEEEVGYFFQEMAYLTQSLDEQMGSNYLDLVMSKQAQMADPKQTLAGQLLNDAPDMAALRQFGLKKAEEFQSHYMDKSYLLHGWESLEISTQDLIKEAIKAGLKIEVIDWDENLIQLSYLDHKEMIRKANMTSYDTLISYFVMENKVATKLVLEQAGMPTPKSRTFTNKQAAFNAYHNLGSSAFVIKPKSTNYGLGITIFNSKPDEAAYRHALEVAFKEDKQVLIEDFVEGTEYRFYVQGDKVQAICERVAAHVVGDGQHTVSELMDIENQHPLRGPQHHAPMTLLEKGDIELLQLQSQGLDFDAIPEKDQMVYLRRNSNISTGGVSIDRTDDIHPSYKDIAIRCSQVLGAFFCGVDIIIQDPQAEANNYNHGIIEANFNPAMMIHRFPGIGQPRYLAYDLIQQIFPELQLQP